MKLSELQSRVERLGRVVHAHPPSTKFEPKKREDEPHSPLKVFDGVAPLSVGNLRRDFKVRQKQMIKQHQRYPKARLKYVPIKSYIEPAEEEPEVSTENFQVIWVRYADMIMNTAIKQIAIDRANTALRNGQPVLLMAHPRDDDPSACRLALRTLHVALNPNLVDPLPSKIETRNSDGVFMLELSCKQR